ncbi:MAG: energy transducer TonB [Nitrospira sp.]|nr:energy transducer TonB [Nitrospira sp.]
MYHPVPSPLALLAGVLGLCLLPLNVVPVSQAAGSPSEAASAPSGTRWVKIDLATTDASGDIQMGKPFDLSIAVGGVAQGGAPLVAICESVLFQRHVVALEPDNVDMVMKGSATMEPIPSGKLSVPPKAARVQVTIARVKKDKFERVLTRVVYVTMGKQEAANEGSDTPLPSSEESSGGESVQEEVQPDVLPVSGGLVVEEDLLPMPTPGQGKAYWQQISYLVSRSWSRTVRHVRHAPTSETVRVKFRLYPSGRVQLIQIEKGSGAREVDEAGIYAVVHAQPFPPFPDNLESEAVDVHVRMRTGAKTGGREVQSITNKQSGAQEAGAASSKK